MHTAATIAAYLGVTPQRVRSLLRDIQPAGVRIIANNEAAAWRYDQLPAAIKERLEKGRRRRGFNTAEEMLLAPLKTWQPVLPLHQIADAGIEAARKLREAMRPWLVNQQRDDLSSAEREAQGVKDYDRVFGHSISCRYWRELFARTLQRDNGAENFDRLEIFLPERVAAKHQPLEVVSEAVADVFGDLESYIQRGINPAKLNKPERVGLWVLAVQKYRAMVASGTPEKRAGRLVREFLFIRVPDLTKTRSREALHKKFSRELADRLKAPCDPTAQDDDRAHNGDTFDVPIEDIERIRWSSFSKNGKRINHGWFEEYPNLTQKTRDRFPRSRKCPAPIREAANRLMVDAMFAAKHSKRELRRIVGGIPRDSRGIPSMASWVVDDMTCNVEITIEPDEPNEPWGLLQPQLIAVMDYSSRKFVGWAISTDKGPTAELSCEAFVDGARRHGVPKEICFENGFTFGNSININGSPDSEGRSATAGLARYGCVIRHFYPYSPGSKGELEKGFDLIQQPMERHPGYGGRNQMLDASEDFKREQRLIRSGKCKGTDYRYTFDEFVRVMDKIIEDYNEKEQYGDLNGISPNEAFTTMQDHRNPPISFTDELDWLLQNETYLVTIQAAGVRFTHNGRRMGVRGGSLPDLIGRKMRVWVNRLDDSAVTFMSLDFKDVFSMEVCERPSGRQRLIASGSDKLKKELAKVRHHERAIITEADELLAKFGNPRLDLLKQFREQGDEAAQPPAPSRIPSIPNRMAQAGVEMGNQIRQIKSGRIDSARQRTADLNHARTTGVPADVVDRDKKTSRGLGLMAKALRNHECGIETETPGVKESDP